MTFEMLEAEKLALLGGERREDIYVILTSYGVGRIEDEEWDE